ncbi:cysteine protease Amb a 11.0101-like [Bidens hawaiensis]|uniref:cysteine protease Amb a 11.0101-like n=1 Tax=Bidens hawaiensis TaxID=980011 RepID=UPI004048FC4F
MEISKSIILLLSLVLVLGVVDSFDYHEKELESEEGLQGMYERWRHHHKVTEKSTERFNVFKYNVYNIHRINKQNLPYKLGINHFATMTAHEWRSTYADTKSNHIKALLGIRNNYNTNNLTTTYGGVDFNSLPPRIDWREHNAVTPVKSQGQCASCFAFASVGAIEGLNAIRTGQLIALSEQQILDCDSSMRTQACSGGLTCGVCDWVVENGGLATEEFYPYTGKKEFCDRAKFGRHAVTLDGREYTVRDDEQDLMKTVAGQPCAFMMDPGSDNFMFYKEGIYNGPCGYTLTHAMLLVGYDQDPDGTKYWIVKNSWGEGWGEKGYIRMARLGTPEGICGMNAEGTFPLKSPETRNIEL